MSEYINYSPLSPEEAFFQGNQMEGAIALDEKIDAVVDERMSQLKALLDDPIFTDKLLYLVPGLNVAKFTYEAGQGETTYGKELNTAEQVISLLEAAAITYCLAVFAKELGGTATHTMAVSALFSKVATGAGHALVMEKETVIKMLNYYSESYPDNAIVQGLIRATSVIPGYMFSKREIDSEELLQEINA